jgi:hypothetical protein
MQTSIIVASVANLKNIQAMLTQYHSSLEMLEPPGETASEDPKKKTKWL